MSSLLRTYIRHIINEVAKNPNDVIHERLGVIIDEWDEKSTIILFDPFALYNELRRMPTNGGNSTKAVRGMITVTSPRDPGEYWGAKEINLSAGQKNGKYGPLLYDIAMYVSGRLVPDRRSVSSQAQQIWKKYYSRGDVKKLKIDNIKNPKTPPTEDDGIIHDIPELDFAYESNVNASKIETLIRIGNESVKILTKGMEGKFSEDDIRQMLKSGSIQFFSERYGEALSDDGL